MKIIWQCEKHRNGDGRIWSARHGDHSVHLNADFLGDKFGRKVCVALLLKARRWAKMSERQQIIETIGPAYFALDGKKFL